MEEQGWGAFHDVATRYGVGWGIAIAVFFGVITNLDRIKRFLLGQKEAENTERRQLSEDTQRLIDNLEGRADAAQRDAEWQRRARIESEDRNEKIIAALREDLSRLIRTTESTERGNSRLRHALNNAVTWGSTIRVKAALAGIEIEPFPLDDLMAFDPELAQKLRDIFSDGDQIIAARKRTQ